MYQNKKQSLLIVDDDPYVRSSLSMVFSNDLEVFTAEDGDAAMRIMQNNQVPVVFLDLVLPGISGLELLSQFQKQYQDTSVILLTAHQSISSVCQAIRYGACDYLIKPVTVHDLLKSYKNGYERHLRLQQMRSSLEASYGLQTQIKQQSLHIQLILQQMTLNHWLLHSFAQSLQLLHQQADAKDLPNKLGSEVQASLLEKIVACQGLYERYLSSAATVDAGGVLLDLKTLWEHHSILRFHQFELVPPPAGLHLSCSGLSLMQFMLHLLSITLYSLPHWISIRAELCPCVTIPTPSGLHLWICSQKQTPPGCMAEFVFALSQEHSKALIPLHEQAMLERLLDACGGGLLCYNHDLDRELFTFWLPCAGVPE